jgi:hypothetical protein
VCVSISAYSFIGPILQIPFISRHQAGVYLCIASVCKLSHPIIFTAKQLMISLLSHFLLLLLSLSLSRHHQNGIPPSVSKRLKVIVNCACVHDNDSSTISLFPHVDLCVCVSVKPKIFAEQRTVNGNIGQKVTLECQAESFPNSGVCAQEIPKPRFFSC